MFSSRFINECTMDSFFNALGVDVNASDPGSFPIVFFKLP